MDKSYLGQIALDYGLLTEEQLERCLAIHESADPPVYLGEVMVQEGFLKEETLQRLLTAQRKQLDLDATKAHLQKTEIARRLDNADLDDFLMVCRELEVSELHFSSGCRPFVRLRNSLVELQPRALDPLFCRDAILYIMPTEERARFAETGSIDFLYKSEAAGSFMVNAYRHHRGYGAVLRAIAFTPPNREALKLPDIVEDIARYRRGLVLVTGPNGSGKSTTLASIIELINDSRRSHIITIEKPIERLFESRASLITQREVGVHVSSTREALECCLREDPDIILIGDLDNPEQIPLALTAAETGHLVLGAMRTPTSHGTITRLLSAYEGRRQQQIRAMLASLLRVIISQRLIPGPDHSELHLAAEVLINTPAVSNLIREDKTHQIRQVIQTSRNEGMSLLDDVLLDLLERGKITIGQALSHAVERQRFINLPPE